jgi:sugar phosphate isomerase/epimerase
VETFGNRKRVLTPEEVGEREIWMVLDTSHLFEERIFDLIDRYHGTIAGVHLSEMRKDKTTGEMRPHMPVEGYGIDVLERLRAKRWHGTVTLEYLPEYHAQLLPDRRALEELFPKI